MGPYSLIKATRRGLLKAGGGLLAASALPNFARADESHPPLGTYPAGSSGSLLRRTTS